MNKVQVWDEAGFRAAVSSGDLVLADFYSEWCGPCKIQAKNLDETIAEIPETVRVGKIDITEAPSAAAEYGITVIPTLMLFRDGTILETCTGVCSRENLLALLKKHL